MDLAFVGFITHHLLPLRFRLPFFGTLVAVIFGLHGTGAKMFVAGLTGRVPLADFPLGNFLYRLIPGHPRSGSCCSPAGCFRSNI
jgi:hypothetical protein